MAASSSSSSSSCSSWLWLLLLLLLLLCAILVQISDSREMILKNENTKAIIKTDDEEEDGIRIYGGRVEKQHHMRYIEPALNVFFTADDLYMGKKMPIYFAINNPCTTPHLLPRQEADSIPFSSSKLTYLVEFFNFSKGSPQAKAMETTLRQCELAATGGEIKFCATSLEAMLDLIREVLSTDKLKVLTTKINTTNFSDNNHYNHTVLQEYSFMEEPLEMVDVKLIACHKMAYPYAVYYCHGHKSENRLFKIELKGENGEKVESIAICHMDTSTWDRDHVAFRVLGVEPGTSSVCHFLPADNLVWVAPSIRLN